MIITDENYFSKEAEQAYFTNSQIKQYQKCPAKWQAKRLGQLEEKRQGYMSPLFQGSYVDMALTEPDNFPQWTVDNAENIYDRAKKKYSVIQNLDNMVERVQRDNYFMKYLEGSQQEIIVIEDFFGHPFKCKLDALNLEELWLTDLKTTASELRKEVWTETPTGEFVKLHWIAAWKYPMQLGLYREAVYHEYMVRPHPYIAAITKNGTCDFGIFDLLAAPGDDHILRAEVERAIKTMGEMATDRESKPEEMEHCERCDYCYSVKMLDSAIAFKYDPKMLKF